MKVGREDGNIVPMSSSGIAEMNSKTRFLLSSVGKIFLLNSSSMFLLRLFSEERQCILTST